MEQPFYMEYDCCCFCRKFFEVLHLKEVPNMSLEACFLEMGNLERCSFKSCERCLQTLEDFYVFNITCTSNAQTIKEYCSISDITSKDVNLYEVYQFLYEPPISIDSQVDLMSTIKLENEVTTPPEKKTEVVEQKYYLKTNMLLHKSSAEVEVFKCKECTYKTKDRSNLRVHLLKHKNPSEVEMFKCEKCTYETKYKSSLKSHTLIHKNPPEVEIFKCKECRYKTKHKGYLRNHILTHKNPSEVEMFKCKECTFRTKHKGYLRTHTLVHRNPSELKMFNCKACAFETKYKTHLRRHILTHKNPAGIYNCQECKFETRRKGNLKKHMLTHNAPGGKIYEECTYKTK